jgi:hypothetical protein
VWIFLWVLAYHLLFAISKTHQVCTIVFPTSDGATLRIYKAATPDPDVAEIYRALALPREVT